MSIEKQVFTGGRAIRLGALLVCVALSVLVAYGLRREYLLHIETARANTRNLTPVLEEHARESLRRVDLSLVRARRGDARQRSRPEDSAVERRNRLRLMLPVDGLLRRFVMADRNGVMVLSTDSEEAGSRNLAERDYFSAHRANADVELLIGIPVKSRIDGKHVLPMSVCLAQPDGSFAGVLVAEMNLKYFQDFYRSIDTGISGFVTAFLQSGCIVARWPSDEAVLTRNWNESPLLREHLSKSRFGTVRQVVAATGIESLYIQYTLSDYPLIVVDRGARRIADGQPCRLARAGLERRADFVFRPWWFKHNLRIDDSEQGHCPEVQSGNRSGNVLEDIFHGILQVTISSGAGCLQQPADGRAQLVRGVRFVHHMAHAEVARASPQALLRTADEQLYLAKSHGRNQVRGGLLRAQ